MKDLMTTKNLLYVGIGLATAYVAYKFLVNRDKKTNVLPTGKPVLKSVDETSDFCGCGA